MNFKMHSNVVSFTPQLVELKDSDSNTTNIEYNELKSSINKLIDQLPPKRELIRGVE